MTHELPTYLTPGWKPFNPLELAEQTERLVCKGKERKYTAFYATGVYGGIATGYTLGCCLRCFFCWGGFGRDFPERYGEFYSPAEVCRRLERVALSCGTEKARISGGAEPTIGRAHLLGLLKLIERSNVIGLFILETNGILLGSDESYARQLSRFRKVHVRVSIKAGTPEGFERRTGAMGEFYELPFKALGYLLRYKVSCHAAAMTDRRLMDERERGGVAPQAKGHKSIPCDSPRRRSRRSLRNHFVQVREIRDRPKGVFLGGEAHLLTALACVQASETTRWSVILF